MDITEYPAALASLNKILSAGREAEVRVEGDNIAVAEHIRVFSGKFEKGEELRAARH